MCGGVGSPGRGHVPELSCQAAPTFPLDFPIPSAPQAPHSQQNAPMLCFAACLLYLITYLMSLMGLLLSEGDPCPVTPFLQIPCVFLSHGSAQLWLLPVPLPYALAATPLLLFCTQIYVTSWTLKAPSPDFGGNPRGHSAIYQTKKKGKGTNLHSFHKGNTKYVPSIF